ncbi:unnamed protein product [Schistocephalus solidus]|uniref:Uncharacterized protein n=1 Tax=Schistocephalus solidus TaxID=70667 RepID=A0A183SNJ7_SCHSO|nr:unnamed protein product [Schistocephalus solidus]
MLLWPPLIGNQLSPMAPCSWALPSGRTPGYHYDRRAKPGEGLRCCVCLHTRNNDPTTSTSATPASDPTTTTTPTTYINFIDAPPTTIIDTILPPPSLAPITAMNTTCPTPATSDYLPPATSTTTATNTSDEDSVLTSRPILSSLSPHRQITHQSGRLLANPSHRDRYLRLACCTLSNIPLKDNEVFVGFEFPKCSTSDLGQQFVRPVSHEARRPLVSDNNLRLRASVDTKCRLSSPLNMPRPAMLPNNTHHLHFKDGFGKKTEKAEKLIVVQPSETGPDWSPSRVLSESCDRCRTYEPLTFVDDNYRAEDEMQLLKKFGAKL